jgi:hypothetical protein
MNVISIAVATLLMFQGATAQKPAAAKTAATDVGVTVAYKGKGVVDAGH